MGNIRVLPPALISRIAAGECIERPASVVKELVENALDAGAGRIDIQLADGGRALIQVADDGIGMDAEDLRLSVTQHATSKLRGDDDLFNIQSLGFRGEALASIAAVSRLRITSRRRECDVGHELRADAGQLDGPRPCAAPPGTRVAVQDLFYPVPARRKFLRTNQTETGHVGEQLARVALAHPGVAFTLRHQERITTQLAATADRRQRIADLFGPELAAVLLPVHRAGPGVTIDGLVAPPAESRGSSKWEYTLVNGRFVRDRFVSHAVREAYRSLIDPARSPVVFLWITIDPGQVDVNVHPTKIEVRWQDSNYIHGQVLAALRDRFLRSNLDHPLRAARDEQEHRERVREAMVDFFRRPPPVQGRLEGLHLPERPPAAAVIAPSAAPVRPDPSADTGSAAAVPARPPSTAAPALNDDVPAGGPRPAPRALQIHDRFLVVETPDGLMVVDQHALHERILYEELRQRLADRPLEAQRLLLPVIVRVPPDRLEALESHAETLHRLGLELAPAGPDRVALHTFPTLLLERVVHDHFVTDLLDRLMEHGSRPDPDALLHELLDLLACKAAVKAGDPLTADEIAALLARRTLAERSSHCPHGRPTTLQFTLRDLERQFHRR